MKNFNVVEYATKAHGVDYVKSHLDVVYLNHLKYSYFNQLSFSFLTDDDLKAVIYLHDIVEDTNITFDDLRKEGLSEIVVQTVWALTDESGTNRKERKQKTYWKIRQNHYALYVKLLDRITNLNKCIEDNDSRLDMYKKEYYTFKSALWKPNEFVLLWNTLDKLHQ